MLYTIEIRLLDGTSLSSLGATTKEIMVYSSMDSLVPQCEFICITNDVDFIGRGVLKFGTELEVAIYDIEQRLMAAMSFCVYNLKLIRQLTNHSTIGTLRVSCAHRWYFKQTAMSGIYRGTPASALTGILAEEAAGEFIDVSIQSSYKKMTTNWYRCNMTALKFIEDILRPNYLIDESPCYLYANDLGQVMSESFQIISQKISNSLIIDPYILTTITGIGDGRQQFPIGVAGYEVDLGDEFAWQTQAQRLIFLSQGNSVASAGVEPMSYLTPLGVFPPKLHQMERNYYIDPLLLTQVVHDDTGGVATHVRARFINSHRKKGIEAFKIKIQTDNDYLLTVASVINLRMTSLPQGSPADLKERLTAEQMRYPIGMDNSILTGRYFIKTMRRNFIQQPAGTYSCLLESEIVKIQ